MAECGSQVLHSWAGGSGDVCQRSKRVGAVSAMTPAPECGVIKHAYYVLHVTSALCSRAEAYFVCLLSQDRIFG